MLGGHDVAYMLARDSLFPWLSAIDNAAFGLKVRGVPESEARVRAQTMLKRVGLAGYEDALPKAPVPRHASTRSSCEDVCHAVSLVIDG